MTPWEQVERVLKKYLDDAALTKFIVDVRKEVGGSWVYVPKNPRPQVEPHDTTKTLQKKFGITARTAQNWLRRYRMQ